MLPDDAMSHQHQNQHVQHMQHRARFPSAHPDYYSVSLNHSSFREDGRLVWGNITSEHGCLVLNFVPVGQHVLGVLPVGGKGKKMVYLSHMIVLR